MRSLLLGVPTLLFVCAVVPACSSSDGGAAAPGTEPSAEGGVLPTGADGSTTAPALDGGPAPKADAAVDAAPPGPSCTNGKKDGAETDVDCGGGCPEKCALLEGCAKPTDCASGLVCVKNTCSSPAANDGIKDGNETDVDCGGDAAPACEVGAGCLVAVDCKEKVCDGVTCLAPLPTDGVQNAAETDVDCGGGAPASACADGKKCVAGARDCTSQVCTGNACQAPLPTDGVKNANETDVDCGGGAPANACGNGKTCVDGARDCTSLVCTGGVCQPPTGTDGVKNGDESDVDCGGTTTGAPKCDATLICNSHADCKSNGCAYNGRCAAGRSCTRQLGGVTCGSGEVGQAGAAHESCCATAALSGSAVRIDKYHVTAGRMRAFIERVAGDVRTFATAQAGWNAAWSPYVPASVAEADKFLGPYWVGAANQNDLATDSVSKRSCNPKGFGGHTYWTPASAGGDASAYTQNELDPKALNCVGWHLAKAFCAWDGGRLATRAEIINAFKNGNTTAYPWDWQHPEAWNPDAQDGRLSHQFSYGFPKAKPNPLNDIAWYVAPPGRHPEGRNANGVEDIAGNLLHYIDDSEYAFTWTASWERHGVSLVSTSWKNQAPEAPNGYYALGFRCAQP
jgi:hypothetical protein